LLVALALTACAPPEDVQPAPTPRPVFSKAASTPIPTPIPVEETRTTTSIRGTVYDTAGNPVPDDVVVRIKAVRPPFDRPTPVKAGLYAAAGVPLRADLTLTVERGGKVLLTRYQGQLLGSATDVVINFGGPATAADPGAPKYGVPL
jgi:hypothetical protein